MAGLLRGGLRPQASVSPAELRAARDLLPEIGKTIAYKANRAGVAERVADPAVQKTIAVDLALMTYYDELLRALELAIVQAAQQHDAPTLSLFQTVPGIGTILSLVLLDAIHRLDRCPSVQACASYGRLVKGSKEAAALFLRNNEAGQQYLARLEQKPNKGKALSILAQKLGRAVYDMLKRTTAFDMALFLRTSGRRAGERAVRA